MSAHRARRSVSRPGRLLAVILAAIAVLGLARWAFTDRPAAAPAAGAPGPSATGTAGPTDPAPTTAGPVPSGTPTRTPTAAPRTPAPSRTKTRPPSGQGQTRRVFITLYGARDNDPPNSRAIAYPVIHREAGGTGTHAHPITFATSKALLPIGTIIYYPRLKRYFIMEDLCVSCDQEWKNDRRPHIDLWAGAATDSGIIDCENALTPDGQVPVIVKPPSNLTVDRTPLYDRGRCYQPR